MRISVFFGFVLGALLLAGWYFAPQFLSDTSAVNARQANEQAELARRQIDAYSPIANAAARYIKPEQVLADGDFQGYSDRAQSAADAHAQQYEGIEDAPPPPPTASPEKMRRGVQDFEAHLKANTAYLDQALRNARQASQLLGGQGAAHIELIQATASLAKAYEALRDAERVRAEVDTALTTALKFALREQVQRENAEFNSDLDVDPIIEELRTGEYGQTELREKLSEVEARLAEVTAELSQKQSQLDNIRAQLTQAQQERIRLERTRADGAMGYNAFRSSYGGVMQRLANLEQQEMRLSDGGLEGAEIDQTDLINGSITGGEQVDGVVQLEMEKANLEVVQTRLTEALETLELYVSQVTKSAELAEGVAEAYGGQAGKYHKMMLDAEEPLTALTGKAVEYETAALEAARDARSGFEKVDRAITEFKRKARDTQSNSDPERSNQRLSSIVNDTLVEHIGKSAEAAARVLEARIHLLRLESVARQRVAQQKLARLTGRTLEAERTLTDLIAAARKEGLDTINTAIEIYNDLAEDQGPTAWAPLSGKGAALYLKSRFEELQRDDLTYRAAETMREAVEGREQSPYLADHVIFSEYLAARANLGQSSEAATSSDPNTATADPNTPSDSTDTTEDDSDDPFADDSTDEDDPFAE